MLSGFFINITILISFVYLFHRLLYKRPLNTSSPLKQKIAAGTASGLLGLVLLAYTIPLNDSTIIDLRLVPVSLMAVFGGWAPAIITGLIVAGGRLLIDFSLSSALAMLLIALSVISGGIIHSLVRNVWRRAVWMILLTNLYLAEAATLYLLPFPSVPSLTLRRVRIFIRCTMRPTKRCTRPNGRDATASTPPSLSRRRRLKEKLSYTGRSPNFFINKQKKGLFLKYRTAPSKIIVIENTRDAFKLTNYIIFLKILPADGQNTRALTT